MTAEFQRISPFEKPVPRLVVHHRCGWMAQPFERADQLCWYLRAWAPLMKEATWQVER